MACPAPSPAVSRHRPATRPHAPPQPPYPPAEALANPAPLSGLAAVSGSAARDGPLGRRGSGGCRRVERRPPHQPSERQPPPGPAQPACSNRLPGYRSICQGFPCFDRPTLHSHARAARILNIHRVTGLEGQDDDVSSETRQRRRLLLRIGNAGATSSCVTTIDAGNVRIASRRQICAGHRARSRSVRSRTSCPPP